MKAALDTVRTAEDHVKTSITARHAALGLFVVLVAVLLALLGMTRIAPGTTVEAPVLTSVPADPTSSTTNTATWVGGQPGVRFRCSVDDGAWFDCTSPLTWEIDPARTDRHRLSVLAVDGSGRESATTAHSFSYRDAPRALGLRFAVAGDISDLAPGLWREVPVRVSNPNGAPMRLTGLTLSVAPDSTPRGCLTATNLEVRQPRFVAGLVVPVPAQATVRLPTEGVSVAAIRLRDLPDVNQDVCKNKAFTLMWSAVAEQ